MKMPIIEVVIITVAIAVAAVVIILTEVVVADVIGKVLFRVRRKTDPCIFDFFKKKSYQSEFAEDILDRMWQLR